LAVPALVYLVGQMPQVAVTTSLAIVGTNSLMGAFFHRAQGTLDWKVAFTFGGAGIFVSYLSANLARHLPPAFLLVIFALLMIAIGIMLFLRRDPTSEIYSPKPLMLVLASGAGVGALTGILGVGGGFLVVPALVMLVGLPVQMAVGTSLAVITMNSIAGFLGHIGNGSFDLILTLIFAGAGLAGTFIGAKLSRRISSSKLQRAFASFVILLAAFLLYDNLPKVF
ncbi:MAG TPA: sulfite exporter TauE/SafE family protein, partial [Anaerolineales bacterium]|nr:sulfite exporter TauE/SafE family protein [Anaerolineales bacterium]